MRTPSPQPSIELALLGYVYAHPAHGYEIYQQLAAPGGLWQVWRLKQSQLYALLAKLDEAGLLEATLEPQEARPPRKMYRLTAAGRAAFQAWLGSPVNRGRQMRIEFLAKLYFAHRLEPQLVPDLLERQRTACVRWLAELASAELEPGAPEAEGELDFFAQAVHEFRRTQVQSFLTWLEQCRLALEKTKAKAKSVDRMMRDLED